MRHMDAGKGRLPLKIESISPENRNQVNRFILDHWYSTDMVVRGEIVDMTCLDGFVIYQNDAIIGLATFRIADRECEIMSLDSLMENQGIGTALIHKVMEAAASAKCNKVKLITTNDNINALRFYQKRGFDMVRLNRGAVQAARKLKPSIPEKGEFDIPIRHEIEFEMEL